MPIPNIMLRGLTELFRQLPQTRDPEGEGLPTVGLPRRPTLADYGIQYPPVRQNILLPEPGTPGFFGRHPRLSSAIEHGLMGAAMTGPSETIGEGISAAAGAILGVPEARRQHVLRQQLAPAEMDLKLREAYNKDLQAMGSFFSGTASMEAARAASVRAQADLMKARQPQLPGGVAAMYTLGYERGDQALMDAAMKMHQMQTAPDMTFEQRVELERLKGSLRLMVVRNGVIQAREHLISMLKSPDSATQFLAMSLTRDPQQGAFLRELGIQVAGQAMMEGWGEEETGNMFDIMQRALGGGVSGNRIPRGRETPYGPMPNAPVDPAVTNYLNQIFKPK